MHNKQFTFPKFKIRTRRTSFDELTHVFSFLHEIMLYSLKASLVKRTKHRVCFKVASHQVQRSAKKGKEMTEMKEIKAMQRNEKKCKEMKRNEKITKKQRNRRNERNAKKTKK